MLFVILWNMCKRKKCVEMCVSLFKNENVSLNYSTKQALSLSKENETFFLCNFDSSKVFDVLFCATLSLF